MCGTRTLGEEGRRRRTSGTCARDSGRTVLRGLRARRRAQFDRAFRNVADKRVAQAPGTGANREADQGGSPMTVHDPEGSHDRPQPGEPPATQSEDPANPLTRRAGAFRHVLLELVPVPVSASIGPRPTLRAARLSRGRRRGPPTSGSCNSARRFRVIDHCHRNPLARVPRLRVCTWSSAISRSPHQAHRPRRRWVRRGPRRRLTPHRRPRRQHLDAPAHPWRT